MRVRVRLHGTLRASATSGGTDLEVPEGTTASGLLRLLGIREERGVVVVMGGRVLDSNDALQADAAVEVFQAIAGGGPSVWPLRSG